MENESDQVEENEQGDGDFHEEDGLDVFQDEVDDESEDSSNDDDNTDGSDEATANDEGGGPFVPDNPPNLGLTDIDGAPSQDEEATWPTLELDAILTAATQDSSPAEFLEEVTWYDARAHRPPKKKTYFDCSIYKGNPSARTFFTHL